MPIKHQLRRVLFKSTFGKQFLWVLLCVLAKAARRLTIRTNALKFAVVLLVLLTPVFSYTREGARVDAAPARTLNFQARLQTASGALVADGNYSIEFKLYNVVTGGAEEWDETRTIAIKNGYFSVALADTANGGTAFGAGIDWSEEKWLTMNVNADGEMTPRIKLTAVPRAFSADTLDGMDNTEFVQVGQTAIQGANSTDAAIRLNQTGAGGLLQLQADGTDILTLNKAGDLSTSGSGTFLGGSLTAGTATQSGSLLLSDGSNNFGILQVSALGQNTTYLLPDPGNATDTICLLTLNNCANTASVLQNGNSFGERMVIGTNDGNDFAIETGGNVQFVIDTGGNVGIGDETPAYLLTVGDGDLSGIDSAGNFVVKTGGAAATADLSFGQGANRSINVLAASTNTTGYDLSIYAGAAGTGATAYSGGNLVLQGGAAAGTGNANGGNILLHGGTGTGTGSNGLVVIDTPAYTTVTNTSCATHCTIGQTNIDSNGAVIVNATVPGVVITLPDPTILTAGRLIYVTASNGSSEFTLLVNGGGTGNLISMRQNTTATMIWNGTDWTAAGASSSTTLQAAYDNTLISAGGAEIILNNSASSDGLTVRNNASTPIIGAIFEAQTSIGSNLFSVNNNAQEYASNGGAETPGATSSTFPAGSWSATPDGATVTRYTTLGELIPTGQASVSTVTGTGVNEGLANDLASPLTSNLQYKVSFAVRTPTSFNTLDVVYSPDGTNTGTVNCSTGITVTVGLWKRVTCTFIVPATGVTSSNAIFIRKSDANAHTYYVDNLSVTVGADANHAADGSADDGGNFATNWTAAPGGGTVSRDTATLYNTSGSARVITTAAVGEGIRNNMNITPAINTQYLVTFYAQSSNSFTDIRVRYTRDGGTSYVPCVDYNTQTVSSSGWTKITCLFKTDGTVATDADLVIDQPTATARTLHVDALSITLNTNTSSNVQIGGGNKGGPVTLLTLDRSSGPPIAANNDAYLGSMYYDTTTGRIQCYEADGWGPCGAPPDNIVNLNPEYAGSVLNGTGIGTMTADFCSNQSTVLVVNSTLCATGQARNFYRWTSPQASQQTYSVYITYQLPSTFKGFSSDDTVQLTGRVDNTTNAGVTYEMFRSESGQIIKCGAGETAVTTSANTWQTVGINGNEATNCGFTTSSANAFVIFKINVKANSNANAYVSTLSFTTTGR